MNIMKKIKTRVTCIITVFLMIICIFECPVSQISAAENPGRLHIDSEISGMTWKLYRIGDAGNDGKIKPDKIFSRYIIPDFLDFKEEIQNLAYTFSSYVSAEKLGPERTGTTDSDGDIIFTGLKEGWYLAVPSETEISGEIVSSTPVMVCLSSHSIFSGTWGTDVKICPKVKKRLKLKFKDIIIKLIDDGPNKSDETVTVIVYRENEEYTRVVLTPDNDWTYVLKDVPDDSTEWFIIQEDKGTPHTDERYPVYHMETSEVDNTPTDIHIIIHSKNPNNSVWPPFVMTQTTEISEEPAVSRTDSDENEVSGGPFVTEPFGTSVSSAPVTEPETAEMTSGGPADSTVSEAVTTTVKKTSSTDSNLPQTGQLWWPVPVMALAGVFLLAAGAAAKRKDGE